MPRRCSDCGAEWEESLPKGDPCPKCGEPLRGRRRDDDDDAPARPKKRRTLLLTGLLGCFGLIILGCAGLVGALYVFSSRPVKILDASRQNSGQGGTSSVSATLRFEDGGRGFGGEIVLHAKAGDRETVEHYRIIGPGGGDLKVSLPTPELIAQSGPVEFWVEREERGRFSRVSDIRTIP